MKDLLIEFKTIGDAFEDEDGDIEFFSKTHNLVRCYYHVDDEEDSNAVLLQSNVYDPENGSFVTNIECIPITELRKLNYALLCRGVKVIP